MSLRDEIVGYAESYLHLPYRWGGDNPLVGLDCSQFVIEVFRRFGFFEPGVDMAAQRLWEFWARLAVPVPIRAGVAFWKNSIGRVCHTGIIKGETFQRFESGGYRADVTVIEATGGQDITTRVAAEKARAMVVERSLGYDRGVILAGYVDPLLVERYGL